MKGIDTSNLDFRVKQINYHITKKRRRMNEQRT
nr:MAG TPA: hypothetical protein [Caudoviricetes sp.]